MAALCVSIDGIMIATVCLDEYDVVSAGAHGTRIDEEVAHVDFSGGAYPKDGESKYVFWLNELTLAVGQTLDIAFFENGSTSYPGKTIEELYPDEQAEAPTDFKPKAEALAEIRAMPKLRTGYSFQCDTSSGSSYRGQTAPEDHGFSFSALWDSTRPEQARVSLHSYTLEALETEGPLNYHLREKLSFGDSVRFGITA